MTYSPWPSGGERERLTPRGGPRENAVVGASHDGNTGPQNERESTPTRITGISAKR